MTKPIEMYTPSTISRIYFEHDAKVNSLNAQISALHISIASERHDNIILQKKLRDVNASIKEMWCAAGCMALAAGIVLTFAIKR